MTAAKKTASPIIFDRKLPKNGTNPIIVVRGMKKAHIEMTISK
jgi:hypothetical protein